MKPTVMGQLGCSPADDIGLQGEESQWEWLGNSHDSPVGHVKVLPRTDVREMIAASDAFVVSTLHDIFGVVAIESLAASTPAITTDTGPARERFDEAILKAGVERVYDEALTT